MGYEIIAGKINKAKKVVVYGPEGIGKSTFASMFPNPLFIDTEGSTNNMEVKRLPRPTSWTMLGEELQQVIKDKPCGTLVVDTIDWAENLCIEHICAKAGKNGIEDFGYGNGYVYEKEEFAKLLNRLEEVIEAGINIVLTAHAQLRKFTQPDEIGEYDRWELKLGKKTGSVISPLVKEWADLLLFVNYKTMAVAVDKDGKKFKAQGNARVMYTEHHPCWDAKNRFDLAPELAFSFSEIAHLFNVSNEKSEKAEEIKYWCHPQTLQIFAGAVAPGDEYFEITYDDYVNMQKAQEEAKKTTLSESTVKAKPIPDDNSDNTAKDYDGIPTELVTLMKASGITEEEIREAVSLKGYYPKDTPIANYDDGFITGVLIGAWDKIKAFILDKRAPF